MILKECEPVKERKPNTGEICEEVITSWDTLPLILNAENIRHILKGDSKYLPSKDTILGMMRTNGFPLITGTKELRCSREAFKNWIMNIKN